MRKRPNHNQTPKIPHKRKGLTSSTIKFSITIHQISKERLEGIDKWYLGNQWRNLGKISITSPRILGPTPKYSYIQTWKNFTTSIQHSQNNFPKPTHSQEFQTLPTTRMEKHPSLGDFASKVESWNAKG